ncbi:MAG: flagellar hook-associated protein FlgK [FCB group bacterium]|jgi:flagellar hook-associated protein FlgK|nr:flagellar hook-associated protein FlgK [FCB group bacterium]
MASGFFNVGVSGLNVAQMGLLTTGHNIANASTEGYNRQYVVQRNNTPVFTGSGFLGTGANVQTVRRVYSDLLAEQVRTAETNVAELETYSNQIVQIDNLLADPSAGVSPTLQDFFSAVSDLASTPNSIPARQAMLSATEALAARFQSVDQQFNAMREGTNTQIMTQVTTINSMVQQVAEINQRIIVAQAAGPGQPANDLYDQRDQLINDLNKEIRVSVQLESDGSYSLFFGTGQPLVVGAQTYQLKAQASPEDLTQIEVGLRAPNGQTIPLPESLISGGKLGGLLQFRSQTLDEAQNSLGRIAMAVAMTVNEQHQLGQDLRGLPGGNFFRELQPTVLGAPTNTGSAQVGANLIQSDYRLEYNGSDYTLTRLSDDLVRSFQSIPITVDGIAISLSGGSFAGTAASPDVFLIRPSAVQQERVTALATNPGSAIVNSSGSNLQTLSTSDFRLEMVGTNQLALMRVSDGQTWTGIGSTQQDALTDLMKQAAPQGFDIAFTGTMVVGDSFLIRPTRYAARDLAVAIKDPREIAAAMAIRTRTADENGGTGAISGGTVVDIEAPLAAPFTVRYEASSNSLVGFPAGTRVMYGTQAFDISDGTTRVPFTAGTSYSIAGNAFSIDSTPADGDVFVIDTRDQGDATPNTISSLLGLPTTAGNVTTGSIEVPPSITVPVGGISFRVNVDSSGTVPVVLPAGTYTPATLASTLQSAINTASGPDVTVAIDAAGQLRITATTSVTVSEPTVTSAAVLAPAFVMQSTSLPVKEITLTYRQAQTSPSVLPARLEGFPAGSRVTLTRPDGTVQEFLMDPTDSTGDYVDFVANSTIEFNGVRFEVSGVPVEGDRFMVGPNPSGVGDARNLLALGLLQQTNTMGEGTATFQSSYAQMVSQVGNKARELDVTQQAQQNLVTQGQNAMQSASGVNLDEEAANLLRYQQAYQAAAKMMNLASSLFEEVLAIAR